MKVLIVEDDPNKSKALREVVENALPGAAFLERRSYQSGLKQAVTWAPDVVLLDMTMPTFDVTPTEQGGRTRTYGGRDVLAELRRRGVSTKVLIVTQFEAFGEGSDAMTLQQLSQQLRREFSELFVGTVYYQPGEGSWKERVLELLKHATARG